MAGLVRSRDVGKICKDRFEAEVWLAGLKALVYSGQGGRSNTDGWSNSGPDFDVVTYMLIRRISFFFIKYLVA
ncbi:hypothetical protein OPV22_020204 [Ensete ventricosum]|uniref:Uncharacterized protein n=1 Tax=Ensete ventricosum TaxID=4639 RepID=A0AAV8QKU6_ENSVE|nr:hypothetical protein OPV22_020204 [Ensete ventricosum]